jgi:hypothetical protein
MNGDIDRPANKENSVDPNVAVDAAMMDSAGPSGAHGHDDDDQHWKLLRQLPPLLKALFRDCVSKSESSATRRSVQQCLRTKARPPGDQVRSVIDEFRDASPTERSLYTASVASLLVSLKKDATTTNPSSSRTSLYYVSYLFVPIQYLHLLLEVSAGDGDVTSHDAHSGHGGRSSSSRLACSVDSHSNGKMVKHVLRCLAGFVCSILENDNSSNGDNKDNAGARGDAYLCEEAAARYRADHVASFVVESLVRINGHYVRRSPTLLSPLWKTISEVADAAAPPASKRGCWSPTVVRHAVRALLDHIQEGMEYFQRLIGSGSVDSDRREDTSISKAGAPKGDPHLVLFRCKIVDFLLDRLSSFLPLVGADHDANDEPNTDQICATAGTQSDLTAIVRVLVLLRGVFALLPQRIEAEHQESKGPSLMSAFAQLADQLEDLVWSRLCRRDSSSGSTTVDGAALDSLFSLHSMDPIERTVLFVGQASVLIRVLERAIESPATCTLDSTDNVECLLRIIHALLFDVLPGAAAFVSCWDQASTIEVALVTKFLRAASALLLRSDTSAPCLASQGDPGEEKFHRWLLSWLAQRPGVPSFCGPGGHPLSYELALSLLHLCASCRSRPAIVRSRQRTFVKLAVTALFHPRAESEFRRRVACLLIRLAGEGCAGGEPASMVSEFAGPFLRNLARSFRGAGGSAKKRKRRRTNSRLAPVDLEIVLSVVAKLDLDEVMTNEASLRGEHTESTPANGPSNALRLQSAAFRSALATAVANRPSASPTYVQHDCLVSYLAAATEKDGNCVTPTAQKYLFALGGSVCEWIRSRCDGPKEAAIEKPIIDNMCQVLCKALQGEGQVSTLEAVAALLNGIQALGTISRFISASIPTESLRGVSRAFHELLSSREWTIRSASLSSMVRFAQTVDAVHRRILPTCVPESCRSRLSSRVKKKLIVSREDLSKARSTCAAMLARCRPKVHSTWILFSKSSCRSTALIATGSFFMTMPTQEGRHAMVIFPPCPESLKDIRFMLGITDEDEENEPMSQRLTLMKILGFEPTREGSCTVVLDEETPM